MDTQVRQYLLTKTLISLGTGALTTVILWIFGVDFALFWGFLAFLFNFIPNVGSLMAVVFPVLLAFLQFDTLVQPFLVLALLVGTQSTMGNIIEPKVMAFSLNLSPLVVLVALIFWGWLWGVVGMIIAVPMTAIIKIVFENIEDLQPLARLLGGPIKQTSS
jgi:predicted PurR-regulated permease PerM